MNTEKIAVLRATRAPREAVTAALQYAAAVANIHSQKKRNQRTERERLENRRYTSTIKTYFHRLEEAVSSGDAARADTELRELSSTVDRAVKRGALHRNTGARKKARAAKLRARV